MLLSPLQHLTTDRWTCPSTTCICCPNLCCFHLFSKFEVMESYLEKSWNFASMFLCEPCNIITVFCWRQHCTYCYSNVAFINRKSSTPTATDRKGPAWRFVRHCALFHQNTCSSCCCCLASSSLCLTLSNSSQLLLCLWQVLSDFPSARAGLPFEYLFDLIPPIQPRAFSIASSLKVCIKDQWYRVKYVFKWRMNEDEWMTNMKTIWAGAVHRKFELTFHNGLNPFLSGTLISILVSGHINILPSPWSGFSGRVGGQVPRNGDWSVCSKPPSK